MKIAIISSTVFPSPTPSYGGLENVVYDLAIGLSERGHDVSLFAPKGSKYDPRIKLYETGPPGLPEILPFENVVKKALRKASFDVISDHSWSKLTYTLPEAEFLPIQATHHGLMQPGHPAPPVLHPCFTALSKAHAMDTSMKLGIYVEYAYNGIDFSKFEVRKGSDGYAIYLGRIFKGKGPHIAARVCEKAKKLIYIVGEDKFVDDLSYVNYVKSLCIKSQYAKYVGSVSHDAKWSLLSRASVMVFPSLWPEPFGLTVLEANAFGVPVVAFSNGALPEIIRDGVNGYLCRTASEMVELIPKAEELRRDEVRAYAEERFNVGKMVERYEELFERVADGRKW